MMFKILSTNDEGQTIYARIDDDGKCRLTCTKDYPEFQAHIAAGGILQDADGNVIDGKAFLDSLE